MYDRAEQDLILASKENVNDSAKMYQLYHKMAQCQLKVKKRHESIVSLECARKYLLDAEIDQPKKIKFDKILKDSIKRISQRIVEVNPTETKDDDIPEIEAVATSTMNEFIPREGKKIF